MYRVIGRLAMLVVLAGLCEAQRKAPVQPEPQKAKVEERRATRGDPAEWAPAEALFYLGVSDVGQLWEDFRQTSGYQMLSRQTAPGAVPDLDVLSSGIEEFKKRLAGALEVAPDQLKNPLDGPLSFYVVAPPGARPEDVAAGLVVGVGDAPLLKKYYDTIVGKLTEAAEHQSTSVGSEIVDVFTRGGKSEKGAQTEEDDFADFDAGGGFLSRIGDPAGMLRTGLDELFSGKALPRKLAMCLTEDRLVVADSAESVKAILQRERRGPTLAESEDYKALLENLKPVGPVRFVVNLPRIIEMARAAAQGPQAEETQKMLKMLGAESLGSLVGHCRLGAASYDSKLDLLLLIRGQRSGLAKLLTPENMPAAPPPGVPAGTFVYAAVNLNPPQVLDEIERMLRQSDPKAADQMRAAMELKQPTGETVNLRKELLDHLRGPLTASFGFAQPLKPSSVRLLLALGHRDQNAVTRALSNPAITQVPLQGREVRGTQVFDVPPMPPFLPAGLAVAALPDRLALGTGASLEAALSPPTGEALVDTLAWQRAARFLPEQAWFLVYIDERGLLETLLALSKKRDEPAGAETGGMDFAGMMVMGMLQGMNQSLKAGDELVKSASQKVWAVATTPAGVQLTLVQLKPEK